MPDTYPEWFFYPAYSPPPAWVEPFVGAVRDARPAIDSLAVDGLESNIVLNELRPALEGLGYEVERGKKNAEKVFRPVLYGAQGQERVTYEIDAAHDEHGIVVEVEGGRGAQSNAIYRDLIRASQIVGARYLVLGVMLEYRYRSGGKLLTARSFNVARNQLDAIYASGRLGLPFDGILLFGY